MVVADLVPAVIALDCLAELPGRVTAAKYLRLHIYFGHFSNEQLNRSSESLSRAEHSNYLAIAITLAAASVSGNGPTGLQTTSNRDCRR